MRIWDLHCHLSGVPGLTPDERMGQLLEYADRMGIERALRLHGHGVVPRPDAGRLPQAE